MNQLPVIQQAESHGKRVAVYNDQGNYTYAEILDLSRRVVQAIAGSGSDLQESRIGFMVPAGAEYAATLWGIWQAGGVAVPLSLSATECELEYYITNTGCSQILATEKYLQTLSGICSKLGVELLLIEELLKTPVKELELPVINLNRRALILHTSGTSSKPKGVVTTHLAITSQITSLVEAWRWEAEDRIPLFLPMHHIHGLINILSCALWVGGRVEAFTRFDLPTIFKRIEEGAYTLFMAVPTIYFKMIEHLNQL